MLRNLVLAPTEAQSQNGRGQKQEGDISAIFPSLSGIVHEALPPRFSQLKKDLISTTEARDRLVAGWLDLLSALREGVAELQAKGNVAIPEVSYAEIEKGGKIWQEEVRKRGSVVVRDVVDDVEALGWKQQILEYVKANPEVKGFPADNKQVFELYWSRPQVLARSHPNLLKTTKSILSLFKAEPEDEVSLSIPLSYADRLRIRLPGDAKFALGHGGGLERWEDVEYRKCYSEILAGNWREFDPFKIGPRLKANSDLYHAPNQCTPRISRLAGTFRNGPKRGNSSHLSPTTSPSLDELSPSNWVMDLENTEFPGAVPGSGQELNSITHPHLMLDKGGMVSMRPVKPGDMVLWHCDGIHSVESKHAGKGDSSVFYIPAVPLTVHNAQYLASQRNTLVSGYPAPDFPGGNGESTFVGPQRGGMGDVKGSLARRAMGLEKFAESDGMMEGERKVLRRANAVLGF
ncbi:putative protein ybiU [Rhizoctonia solani AG-1 IB]|uniref:DUF1479-domain-containing protein n=2 Tax=Rhizoctonia solani TaxID=456999 RepID=A0A8H3GG93_9AGAM|nr:unnamed protein product [Rhizoctonia solani]CCO29197.1 putative protein ybiU [Rhizoctonia solani AG-1 IB]